MYIKTSFQTEIVGNLLLPPYQKKVEEVGVQLDDVVDALSQNPGDNTTPQDAGSGFEAAQIENAEHGVVVDEDEVVEENLNIELRSLKMQTQLAIDRMTKTIRKCPIVVVLHGVTKKIEAVFGLHDVVEKGYTASKGLVLASDDMAPSFQIGIRGKIRRTSE